MLISKIILNNNSFPFLISFDQFNHSRKPLQVGWHLGGGRQEDLELDMTLGYTASSNQGPSLSTLLACLTTDGDTELDTVLTLWELPVLLGILRQIGTGLQRYRRGPCKSCGHRTGICKGVTAGREVSEGEIGGGS